MLLSVAPIAVMAAELGDVDGNGKIDATDARTALRAAVGLDKLKAEQVSLADVDFDGDVDATDARLILRAAVGLEKLHVHSYKDAVTTAATCEGKGVKTFTCSCGDSYTEEIAALGHKEVTDKATAPDCTKDGKTEGSHCSVCNKVLKAQDKVPATGHKAVTDKAVAPSCTASGKTEGSHCSVCNAVIKAQETVKALGHKAVTDKAVEATCTKTGLTEGSHCSVCNAVIKAQETIPAKGHTKVTDKAVAPTCTANGVTEGAHCSVCNTVIKAQETVPAKGHTEEIIPAVAATCTKKGLTEGKKCKVCGILLQPQAATPMTAHTEKTVAAVAPTCTEAGLTEGKICSVCNKVTVAQTAVQATGHLHSSLDESTVKEANCNNDGYTGDYKCDVCGTVTATGTATPKLENAHRYEQNTVEASCTADEYIVWQCVYCESIDSERIEMSGKYPEGKGHTFGAKTTVAPNCTDEGYDVQTCSVCTYEERTNPVSAKGHNYKKNVRESVTATCLVAGKKVSDCTVCGDKKTEELGFAPHTPATVQYAGTSYANGDSCKTLEKCSVCEKVLAEAENFGAHKYMMATGPATEAKCETAGTQTLSCADCGYEYTAVVQDAKGHSNRNVIVPATCDTPGSITSYGKCDDCGKDMGDGTTIPLPAKGHKLSGVQSCTTSVTCGNPGCEYKLEAFGHDFQIESSAVTQGSKTVPTFFCERCGEGCEDKLATFNDVTAKIKPDFFGKYDYSAGGYPVLHRIIKTSAENTPSNINFGIYTSIVRDMFAEEMEVTPVSYAVTQKTPVRFALPIFDENYVSVLEKKDVDSISVERMSGLEFSKVFEGFDDKVTYGKNEYDLTKYKSIKVNENVIKVTIDVRTEKYYGGIDKLSAAEQTALQKIFGIDAREQLFSDSGCTKNCPENCAEHHYVKGGDGKLYMETNQEGMRMKMILNDLTTDGKVTYYFLEKTYQPIIAVYEENEAMNQHMDMSISVGLTIRGSMDTLSKTDSVTIYVFPGYFPA